MVLGRREEGRYGAMSSSTTNRNGNVLASEVTGLEVVDSCMGQDRSEHIDHNNDVNSHMNEVSSNFYYPLEY